MVIDKLETAVELFERRSANYSDRTAIPMFDLMKLPEYLFAFKPYCAPFCLERFKLVLRPCQPMNGA
jgi:hypothetical protein